MIFRARVLASWAETPTVHAVRVEKPVAFTFRPVQFCGLELATEEGVEEYPMSLACAPARPYLEFATRVSRTAWKRAFAALREGDVVEVDGPYGHFVLDETRDAVFVAGGIGITPLKGMAEHLADTGSMRRAVLVFSNKDQAEIVYRAELEALARANPRFEVVHTLTREPEGTDWAGARGRIDARLLRRAAASMDRPVWYLCGTPGFVASSATLLHGMGVPTEAMRGEKFSGY